MVCVCVSMTCSKNWGHRRQPEGLEPGCMEGVIRTQEHLAWRRQGRGGSEPQSCGRGAGFILVLQGLGWH